MGFTQRLRRKLQDEGFWIDERLIARIEKEIQAESGLK
jgi:hypothetical protein